MAAIKNECPGGGIAVNVSPAEAERKEYHCQCGRWIKFRKGYAGGYAHGNGGWPTPFVPRHSATPPKVKAPKARCGKLVVDDFSGDDGWCKRPHGHRGKCDLNEGKKA